MSDLLPIDKAKSAVITAIARGVKVETAMEGVGRVRKTYEQWRKNDPQFAAEVDRVRGIRKDAAEGRVSQQGAVERGERLPFAAWRSKYLHYETYPHQQQWVDVLEGEEPTPIEGCEYRLRNPKRLLINTPPGHAKSTTITVDYVTYKICMNPNIRVLIISKKADLAAKFLTQIKNRLTSNLYPDLIAAYAPQDGFRPAKGEGQFSNKVIYVAGRTADHKDPTIEIAGLGSAIYGGRFDLIILDDVIDLENADNWSNQMDWVQSIVDSRLKNGTLLVVGTRLKAMDLYAALLDDENYTTGKSPWTYLRQPAVLSFAEEPADWVTLWPKSTTPYDEEDYEKGPGPDGKYTVFDGPTMANIRSTKKPSVWATVYMQVGLSEDADFTPELVRGAINRRRKPGPLKAGAFGHPREGGDGKWTIASMDPAMAGDTFVLVGKVDRVKKMRYIENAWVKTRPTTQWIRDIIKTVTLEYGVNEWVIESNAFQLFLTEDQEIRSWLQQHGVRLNPHYTGRNKADPDFGVKALAPLFGSTRRINEGAGREVHNGDASIELPDVEMSQGLRELVQQLYAWEPGRRGKDLKMDGPMALWFFELRAKLILRQGGDEGEGQATNTVQHRFASSRNRALQHNRPMGFFGRRR